mmetsp:Transcript_13013/g.19617  ORF Transcript_13013/g.19617 Transcript_13013/m.19617 type:complete len:271 (-) Transcript_13013:664-1476(-)
MFIAELERVSLFRKLLENMKDLVTETNFECSPKGITVQAMDDTHVSLVYLSLEAELFKTYKCDRTITLGINLDSMNKVLKWAADDDSLTLTAKDDENVMNVRMQSKDAERDSQFNLRLVQINADTLNIPDSEYDCVIQMPSRDFKKIVNDLTPIGDAVTIGATKKGVTFKVSGQIGSGSVLVRQSQGVDVKASTIIELKDEVEQFFALRYLNLFSKCSSIADVVTLSISSTAPLIVDYKFATTGNIAYYLAPKIDENDDDDDSDDEDDYD